MKEKLDTWAKSRMYPTGETLKKKLAGHYGGRFLKHTKEDMERKGCDVDVEQIRRLVGGRLTDLMPWVEAVYEHWAEVIPDFCFSDPRLQDPVIQRLPDFAALIAHKEEIVRITKTVKAWAEAHKGEAIETAGHEQALISSLVESMLGVDTKQGQKEKEAYDLIKKVQEEVKDVGISLFPEGDSTP